MDEQSNDQTFPLKGNRGRGRLQKDSSYNTDSKPNDGRFHMNNQRFHGPKTGFKPKQDYIAPSTNHTSNDISPRREYLGRNQESKSKKDYNHNGSTYAARAGHGGPKYGHRSDNYNTGNRSHEFRKSAQAETCVNTELIQDEPKYSQDESPSNSSCIKVNFRKIDDACNEEIEEDWDKGTESVSSGLNPTAIEFTPNFAHSDRATSTPNDSLIATSTCEQITAEDDNTYKAKATVCSQSSECDPCEEPKTNLEDATWVYTTAKSTFSKQYDDSDYANKRKGRNKRLDNSFHSDNDYSFETTFNTSNTSSIDAGNDSVVNPNASGKLQSSKYKTSKYNCPAQRRSYPIDNSNLNLTDFEMFQKKFRNLRDSKTFNIVEEVDGDLFAMDECYALANCVASDFNMGSGIAVTFRQQFKNVDELLAQNQNQGGLAFLNINGRFIYYLVTKRESSLKPTYETLFKSLTKLREHMVENKVKLLAIPRLGCGLDRLEWTRVKIMIEYIFQDLDVKITVCNYQKANESMRETKEWLLNRKCPVIYSKESITTVDAYSIILYLGTEKGQVGTEITQLDTKFKILQDYKKGNRALGNIIPSIIQNYKYYVVGCIVKKDSNDTVDFKNFEKCIKEVNKINNKFKKTDENYTKVAMQTYRDPSDPMLMTKIGNLMKNTFANVTITLYDNSH